MEEAGPSLIQGEGSGPPRLQKNSDRTRIRQIPPHYRVNGRTLIQDKPIGPLHREALIGHAYRRNQ